MLIVAWFLVVLSLAAATLCQQAPLGEAKKTTKYNVTLDFDDLHTNTSGVGFHPNHPEEAATSYKSVYLQSFTLRNVDTANLTGLDMTCSRSWPNSVFASRRPGGFAWPRISLHDLSKVHSESKSDADRTTQTFGLVSLWLRPVGQIPGAQDSTLGVIQLTMLRVHVASPAPPDAGFPGIVRGQPLPTTERRVAGIGIGFPGGRVMPGFQLNVRQLFGVDYATGIDTIEVVGQVLRRQKNSNEWKPAEDWELCMDDIVLEIVDGHGTGGTEQGDRFVGVTEGDEVIVGDEMDIRGVFTRNH